jgi:hypothetical protein
MQSNDNFSVGGSLSGTDHGIQASFEQIGTAR